MLLGLHHVTAIAGDPQRNFDFYTGFLGMRLVKRTVNFDEPSAYHFYFSGGAGTPGTLLTFFPWVNGRKGLAGSGQIASLSLSVAAGSLAQWKARAAQSGMNHRDEAGKLTIFDPDGIAIELIDADRKPSLQAVTLRVTDAAKTGVFLQEALGLTPEVESAGRLRYRIAEGPDAIEVIEAPEMPRGKMASGIVHHVALRVADEDVQLEWREKLLQRGLHVSAVRDRLYFHSIYFREPGGVLLEIATDGPGFSIDEDQNLLGERLCLPPWLEPERASIERRLPEVNTACLSQPNL